MSRHTYSVEVHHFDKWTHLMTERICYCLGWLASKREAPGPRLAYRLVRGDGRVHDEVSAIEGVSIGQAAGFPTADQYERAGQAALEQARLIREREADRKARRGEP